MIFLNSASSAAALVFYLTALCTQTDTEGKQSSEYFEKIGKKHNEHPLCNVYPSCKLIHFYCLWLLKNGSFNKSSEVRWTYIDTRESSRWRDILRLESVSEWVWERAAYRAAEDTYIPWNCRMTYSVPRLQIPRESKSTESSKKFAQSTRSSKFFTKVAAEHLYNR